MARMLRISGEITPVTAELFIRDLTAGKGPVEVRVNSEGGDCQAGFDILDALEAYPDKTIAIVESLAASMASVVILACDEVVVNEGAEVMIHPPEAVLDRFMQRNTADNLEAAAAMLRKLEARLIKVYSEATGLDADALKVLWEAEPYFNAKKCVELGFADRIGKATGTPRAAACIKLRGTEPHEIVRMVARAKGNKQMDEEQMKALRASLGLAADASAEDIQKAVAALKAKAEETEEEPAEEETEEEPAEDAADSEALAEAVGMLPVDKQAGALRALSALSAGSVAESRDALIEKLPEKLRAFAKRADIKVLRAMVEAHSKDEPARPAKRAVETPASGTAGKPTLRQRAENLAKAMGGTVQEHEDRLRKAGAK